MENAFKKISNKLFSSLNRDEVLMLSISGENSDFCRFNQSKVRQIGEVLDSRLSLSLINDKRICHGSITLGRNLENDINEILNPYFTTKKSGTGLGLPIVTKIINEHSGYISIKNKKKETGAVISISLPKFNA